MTKQIQKSSEEFWIKEQSLQCMINNDLVYVGIPENDHDYYRPILLDNDWSNINFKDIDWGNHTVFGFIQDPLHRYCKGLAEDMAAKFCNPSLEADMIPLLKHVNSSAFPLSFNSMPIFFTLGDYMYDMTWIPIGPNSDSMLDRLCKEHDIAIDWTDSDDYRIPPNESKTLLINQTKDLIGNGNGHLWRMLCRDVDLFNSANIEKGA